MLIHVIGEQILDRELRFPVSKNDLHINYEITKRSCIQLLYINIDITFE